MSAARIITVVGSPVRLYPPPGDAAEFPWCHFPDRLIAAEFPSEAIEAWADRWRTMYPERYRVAADCSMIVPAEAGTGLFEAARQMGWGPAERALGELRYAIHELFTDLHRDLTDAEFRVAMNEAVLRAAVMEGGVH